ncbi:MAG TPA: extracellular solute-binding protein [Candidatus Angelobacter sp.]|nr:extracellular solute-binding protein [Candidatus Angelobacter sp.]
MKDAANNLSRRELLTHALRLAAVGAVATFPSDLSAAGQAVLDVAYAGSMTSIMEGPIKAAVAQRLGAELHGRAQGASGLAQLIAGGSIRPDVFISITPSPVQTVFRAAKAELAEAIAHTEMVIAYSPKSRFAAKFEHAGKSGAPEWWQILQEPGIRFGRTDPVTDPQGRNIIFTMMLAARHYKQPDLVEKILGATNNERQIFTEPSVQARLQSGELDAASAYKIQPGPFHIPYLTLPEAVNLSGRLQEDHGGIALTVGEKTYHPEPLIYYAAVLKDAPNPKSAAALVEWLKGEEAQSIFRRFDYDPPGDAAPLRA